MSLKRAVCAAGLLAVLAIAVHAQQAAPAVSLQSANEAWNRGDYVAALSAYTALLSGPGGDAVLEPIALQTGELYKTIEVTGDGLNPRFSPDGKLVAYETGAGAARVTKIVDPAQGMKPIAEFPGHSAAFSPAGEGLVYLKPVPSDEIAKAALAAGQAAAQGGGRGGAQLVNYLQTKYVDIVVRDIASGRERVCPTDGFLKQAPAFSAHGDSIYFHGAREADPSRNDIYAMPAACGVPQAITPDTGFKAAPAVDPTGQFLVYAITTANPFRRPAGGADATAPGGPPAPAAGQAAGGAGGGGAGGGRGAQSTSFAILDLKASTARTIQGTGSAISADGSTLAYIARSGEDYTVMAGPLDGTPAAAKKTRDRIGSVALSPDGGRIALQEMPKDDWEIFVVNRDGSNETRVTREIQHDTQPRFLTGALLLSVMGEPRHTRSYLYDLTGSDAPGAGPLFAPVKKRLFHNNTVRTIAPEYAWVPSADGRQILIGADRDGDTVSPERGIYLVSLDRKVSKAEVLARIETSLAGEKALRAAGERMFAPIAAGVKQVLAAVSVTRIFEYEKALFDFDSKHISKPGNKLAGEYLFNLYRSFGYEPQYQWFEPRGALNGKTANIIATLKGTENPELIYVVCSHYDSVVAGPGADDDSSGTAALLEAARVLAKRPLPATVIFASFTGEENGDLGSHEFVRLAQAAGWKMTGVLNNDMIGWANDYRLDNLVRYTNPGIRDLQHGASFFTRLITYDTRYYKSTDAAAFYDVYGDIVGGIGSYPLLGNPHYHQATDLLETVNHELVAETSKTTIASIMLMASSPSRLAGLKVQSYQGKTAKLAWTASAEKSVRSYVVAYGPEQAPLKNRVTVLKPEATLPAIEPGTVVSVKAVNAKGLEGWGWATVVVR